MTISTEAAALSYDGDDVTTAFPITWKYFLKSHVVATLRATDGTETIWVLATDYTLTDAGVDAGGDLTATTPPATNETLVITLEPPNTQTSDIPLGGSFPANTVEDALDQAAQRDSKLEDFQDRTLRVPKTDTQSGSDLEIPIETERADKFLAFDANGDPIAAAGTSANLGPVSAYIDTLLPATNASAARTTLVAAGTGDNNAFTGNNTHAGTETYADIISQDNTTESTSTTTGSIHTDGGMGIAKTLVVGTGIILNGGTNGTNQIGDYEQGTWTPSLSDGTNTAGSESGTGRYTKIGDIVQISGNLAVTTISPASGDIQIDNLPFVSLNAGSTQSSVHFGDGSSFAITASTQPAGFIGVNTAVITITIWDDTVGTDNMVDTQWSDGGAAKFSATYRV